MSDCCSSSCSTTNHPKRHRCPVNGQEYKEVATKTILHHIKEPWLWPVKDQAYYFCDDPNCKVVYFGQDNFTVETMALRTTVGVKEQSQNSTLCYCFGVSLSNANNDSNIKQFVTEKTKNGFCACEIRNPSGKCCLKDFPKQ